MESDNRRVGAQHEIAHALAYIAHGFDFRFAELDQVGCGKVHVDPRRIRDDQLACIAMAGPATEFAHHLNTTDEDELITDLVDGWSALSDLIQLPDDEEIHSDEAKAAGAGLLVFGFSWASGFYESNRELIVELAQALLAADGHLDYDTINSMADGRISPPNEATQFRQFVRLQQYTDRISAIQDHIREVMLTPAPSLAD